MSKTGVSKHNTWINVVIDIAEGEAEQLIECICGRGRRAGRDYTCVIGALFEWPGLKLVFHSDSKTSPGHNVG